MTVLRCSQCGGTLSLSEDGNYYICDHCDTPTAISNINDEKILQLKERANRLFLACDFDGAAALYQAIVSEVTDDAESYWLLALCAYGIQYVDDPLTQKKIPTCHRTSYTSILNNEDYLNALDCADVLTRMSYEKSAKMIDEIQQGILSIVSKEKPYDIFICYKETSEEGYRTKESAIAQDLYYKLTAEGYRVFYAPITLQEKAGREYEPFIFAALNSAKIMFVIGFSRQHYEAVWVKNEWSRFLARKAKNPRLLLVACYNSFVMDANDLPELLNKTQARDLSNASTNDLVTDTKKWLPKKTEEPQRQSVDVANIMGGNASSLLKRGEIYLEDREFSEAIDCFNKSLDLNPELSKAYWGLILAKYGCRNNTDLSLLGRPISELNEYKKAARFADDAESEEYQSVLTNINNKIQKTLDNLKESKKSKIFATGVKEELESGTKNIQNIEENYNNFISQLDSIEKQIMDCVKECKNVIAPQTQKISVITQNSKNMLNGIKGKSFVGDEEKDAIFATIEANNNEIKNLVLNVIPQIKKDTPCFSKLNDLLAKQRNLFYTLNDLAVKLQRQSKKFDDLCKNMYEIGEKYAPSFNQVLKGDYSLSSKLLGTNDAQPLVSDSSYKPNNTETYSPAAVNEDYADKDNEAYEVTCPACNNIIYLDENMLAKGGIDCPNCRTNLVFDFDCD